VIIKYCTKCEEEKPLEDFGDNRSRKDGKQAYCKKCRNSYLSEWYLKNKRLHKDRVKINSLNKKLVITDKLLEYLVTHPCVDCGESDPVVLEFDHRNPLEKQNNVSTLIGKRHSWESILAEIDKCEVRCANCHHRRTAIQFGWYKLDRQ
jgi:hypothetical protein